MLKCIFCLIKCSKYIYFVKKVICLFVVFLSLVCALLLYSGENKKLKKLLKEIVLWILCFLF